MLSQARCCVLGTVASHGQGQTVRLPLVAYAIKLQKKSLLQRRRQVLLDQCSCHASAWTHWQHTTGAWSSAGVFSPLALRVPPRRCSRDAAMVCPRCCRHLPGSKSDAGVVAHDSIRTFQHAERFRSQPLPPLYRVRHCTFEFSGLRGQARYGCYSHPPGARHSPRCRCDGAISTSLTIRCLSRAGRSLLAGERSRIIKSRRESPRHRWNPGNRLASSSPPQRSRACTRPFAILSYPGIRGDSSVYVTSSSRSAVSGSRLDSVAREFSWLTLFRKNFGTQRVIQKRRHQMRILHPAQTPYIPHEERRLPIPHSLTACSTVKRLLNNNTVAAKESAKRINWEAYVCNQRGVRWHPQGAWRVQFSRRNHERNFFVRCECYFRVSNYGFETAKELAIRYRKRLEMEWEELQEQWMKLDILEAQKRQEVLQKPDKAEHEENQAETEVEKDTSYSGGAAFLKRLWKKEEGNPSPDPRPAS